MSSFFGSLISEPTSLVIQELTGPQNRLELIGRCLPYRPMKLSGSMRAEFTWYPGNPVATVQMLGAEEAPTTINGMWKDRFMRSYMDSGFPVLSGRTGFAVFNGRELADVRALVQVIEGFRLRGQLIEMSWDEVVRQGILASFTQTWLRREDVEWEIEFKWVSRGEPASPVAFASLAATLASRISSLGDSFASLIDAITNIINAPFAMIDQVQNEINNGMDDLDIAAAAFAGVVDKGARAITTPIETARNALAATNSIKESAQQIVNTMNAIPARAIRQSAQVAAQANEITTTTQTTSGTVLVATRPAGPSAAPLATSREQASGIATVTHEQALQAEAYKRAVKQAAFALRNMALRRAQELAAQTTVDHDAIVVTVGDQNDLRDLAQAYYGTQEEWKRLLLYNNLGTSKLEAGQIVLVPSRGGVSP